jgi:hypothetical protein
MKLCLSFGRLRFRGTGYASIDSMGRHIVRSFAAAVVTIACSVTASFAQTQGTTTPARTPEPAHKVYKLTGCLMAGSLPGPTFKLTDAWTIGQPTPGQAGEAGAVGTSSTTAEKTTYELRPVSGVSAQGLDAEALKAHLGHRVEVVARPIESPPPDPPSVSAQTARPVQPSPERFTVTELKRVVGRCS